jgi:hypothetical protein
MLGHIACRCRNPCFGSRSIFRKSSPTKTVCSTTHSRTVAFDGLRWISATSWPAVLTEGLLIYLTPREAGSLGRDLAAAGFTRWVLDLHSPAVLRAQQHNVGPELRQAGTPFRFAPRSGADFFWHAGWEPIETRSIIRAAMRLGRIPRWNWAAAVLAGANGLRATVCLLARKTCAIGGDWHAPAMSRALSAMR